MQNNGTKVGRMTPLRLSDRVEHATLLFGLGVPAADMPRHIRRFLEAFGPQDTRETDSQMVNRLLGG